ncbi:MAG TPA: carbonic anhydrase [Acidobacteriaceae bacterium]|jgi:carbonic anhydrase|nr:carbonic anhydrase [Acidobacteriaceae bacterium]
MTEEQGRLSRRTLLQGALAATAVAAVPRALRAMPNTIPPSAALQRLMDGNARYVRNQIDLKDFSAGRAARAEAQFPVAAILGCADSRVAPEFIFDQDPGELFVCRVAGNYMNVDILASLEYGVEVLGAPLVMVLGHTNCGAVKAVLQYEKDRKALPGHLQMLLDAVSPGVVEAIRQGPTDQLNHAIEANVRHNAQRLRQANPVIAKAVEEKRVDVVSAVYELATGQVRLLK